MGGDNEVGIGVSSTARVLLQPAIMTASNRAYRLRLSTLVWLPAMPPGH